MIKVNIHEAKTQFSKFVEKAAKGQTITICKNNVPVAELRPIPKPVDRSKLFGYDKGKFEVGPEFFEPVDDFFDVDAFNGLK